MKVHTATLAGGSSNADRVFVTDHAVILLDGASAFAPVDVEPGDYAAILGETIADQLDCDPICNLPDAVADAIAKTTTVLRLDGKPSPSSTVTILRIRDEVADLYVLGDSPIHYGTGLMTKKLTDNRLAKLGLPARGQYKAELARGAGYTNRHHTLLVHLQETQREHRNRPGGYWIAGTEPVASHHAVTAAVPASQIAWAVLATDGAADVIRHHGAPSWPRIARYNSENLFALIANLHRWEDCDDPDGQQLPRAKRHDDKTIASVVDLW